MRFWIALSLCAVFSGPLSAQFAITLQENGQATNIANGGSITLNAPAVGQSITGTVTLTNLGTSTTSFSPASIVGSNFTTTAATASLSQFESTTFTITYTAVSTTAATGEFLWTFNEFASGATVSTGAGAVSFNLLGGAPNILVSEVDTNNTYTTIPNAGTIQFLPTPINSSSKLTLAVSNAGSGPATINSITATGAGFQLLGVPLLPLTLAAGSQLTITAQFQPTSAGAATGSLQIAFASGTYSASLAGTVTSFSILVSEVDTNNTYTTIPNAGTIQFLPTPINSSSKLTLAVSNAGSVPATINSITATGAGFQLLGVPLLPLTLAAGSQLNIAVQFQPTSAGAATGSLQIAFASGTYSASLAGTGVTSFFTYQITQNNVTSSVSPGQTITFNNTGSPSSAVIQFQNTGTTAATVSTEAITGLGLSITSGSILPLTLQAGQSNSLTVTYTPTQNVASTGQLLIGSDSFPISAVAPPALPAWLFTGASGQQQPFEQPAIGLSLVSTYPIDLSGILTISVSSASFVADPAVQFSSGGLQVAFSIPANTLQAVFAGGSTQIRLQTGTVAGSILITPTFTIGSTGGINVTPSGGASLQLTVPALAPTLLIASIGTQTTTSLTVVLTGYSTTRDLGNLTVQFTPSSGFTLSTSAFTLNLSAAASVWFLSSASASLGGQFNVEIPFTFGPATTTANLTASVSAITLSATNSIGASNSIQLTVP